MPGKSWLRTHHRSKLLSASFPAARRKNSRRHRHARHALLLESLENRTLLTATDLAAIGGISFTDVNSNGVQDAGEPGIQGVTIDLFEDTNGNGIFEPAVDSLRATDTTKTINGKAGTYRFDSLVVGDYFVRQPAQVVGNLSLSGQESPLISIDADHVMGVSGTTIDSFNTTIQSVSASNSPTGSNPDADSSPASEAIGGERDLFAELTSPTGRLEILVNNTSPGRVDFLAGTGSTGERLITWDGTDGDASNVDATGLGGIDLTQQGASTGIRFLIGADLSGGMAKILVYTDANRVSEAVINVPQTTGGIADEEAVVFFDQDFIDVGTTSGASFDNVGAIQFEIVGTEAIDVQSDLIEAIGPTLFTHNFPNVPVPAVELEKSTNGVDADSATGPLVAVGATATFQYVVTNAGNVALGSVTVTDDQGVLPILESGDTDGDSLLDVDETWTYSATRTVTAGQYSNLGSVDANPVDATGADIPGIADVEDSDPSYHFGVLTGIGIEKSTNGQDADTPTGPNVQAGSTVTFEYVVTNEGNVPLGSVAVTDDQGVIPVFQGGDLDADSLLDVSETWTYQAAAAAQAGQRTNIGAVVGNPVDENGGDIPSLENVEDSDPSHHFGVMSGIDLEKSTNGEDADSPATGPTLFESETVNFLYEVRNTGNVPLSNVVVMDDRGAVPVFQGGDLNSDDRLDLNEVWRYSASTIVVPGQYTNIGTVSAVDTLGDTVRDEDSSNHFGEPRPALISMRACLSSKFHTVI